MLFIIALTLSTLKSQPIFLIFGRHTLREICNWRIYRL